MTSHQDKTEEKAKRVQEAARIVRRLDETPDDPQALADKRAFLARGEAEQRTYALAERAFTAARKGIQTKDTRTRYGFTLLAVCLASLYLAWEPLSVSVLADHRSGRAQQTTTLASGDVMVLDASSALQDQTEADVRSVTLLRGAGFFDVTTDGRPFVVRTDDVSVEVLGTQFEVARVGGKVRVTVAEGTVQVSRGDTTAQVTAGEQVLVSAGLFQETEVAAEDVARWRDGELSLTGLTLAEAASMVDRRVPGRVVVVGAGLRDMQVGGVLDLTVPENALATLAAIGNATVIRTSPALTLIYRQ
ncbi:MAG: FecR domain-containing protein [Pseudomonadota bacterium]